MYIKLSAEPLLTYVSYVHNLIYIYQVMKITYISEQKFKPRENLSFNRNSECSLTLEYQRFFLKK